MDMSETRNDFGFPVADKLARAQQIASGAMDRKQERDCKCHRCVQAAEDDKLAAVINIVNAWKPAKQFKPRPRMPYLIADPMTAEVMQQHLEHVEKYRHETPF